MTYTRTRASADLQLACSQAHGIPAGPYCRTSRCDRSGRPCGRYAHASTRGIIRAKGGHKGWPYRAAAVLCCPSKITICRTPLKRLVKHKTKSCNVALSHRCSCGAPAHEWLHPQRRVAAEYAAAWGLPLPCVVCSHVSVPRPRSTFMAAQVVVNGATDA